MADFKATLVGDDGVHSIMQVIWTATATEKQDATKIIDIDRSASKGVRQDPLHDIDRLSIVEVCNSMTLPANRSVFLLDSENNVILALNTDSDSKIKFAAGGLRGTKELDDTADGSLYVAMGQSVAKSSGTASGTVAAGTSYSLQIKVRKKYED